MTAWTKSLAHGILGMAAISCVGLSAQARERNTDLVNKALADSIEERKDVDQTYRADSKTAHQEKPQVRAISLEIGDELGPTGAGSGGTLFPTKDKAYREHAVAQKLDREWKEVNRSIRVTNEDH